MTAVDRGGGDSRPRLTRRILDGKNAVFLLDRGICYVSARARHLRDRESPDGVPGLAGPGGQSAFVGVSYYMRSYTHTLYFRTAKYWRNISWEYISKSCKANKYFILIFKMHTKQMLQTLCIFMYD